MKLTLYFCFTFGEWRRRKPLLIVDREQKFYKKYKFFREDRQLCPRTSLSSMFPIADLQEEVINHNVKSVQD